MMIFTFLSPLLFFFSLLLLSSALSSSVRVDSSLSSLLNATKLPKALPELTLALSRQLVGAGFHRTLQTKVERVSFHQHNNIIPDHSMLHVAIVENITRDMYVDIDQVSIVLTIGGFFYDTFVNSI